jgi:hypothetical protein
MLATDIAAPPTLPLLGITSEVPASRQPIDMAGEISHRLLVNFRIAPHALAEFDLGGFEWDTYEGTAFLSVCLLRYNWLGPTWWPKALAHRGSSEILYRLAVRLPGSDEGPVRGFVSLLTVSSSPALAFAGRRFAPHRWVHAPVNLLLDGPTLSVSAPGTLFETDLRSAQLTPPPTTVFASLHDAETFLLDLPGHISLDRRGAAHLQPINHSPWASRFLLPETARFGLLEPWVEEGLLSLDSVLYMANLRQLWKRTRPLSCHLASWDGRERR